jgi:hypothetical protein
MAGIHAEDRQTVFTVGIGEYSSYRLPWDLRREGMEIASGSQRGAEGSVEVQLQASGYWTIFPKYGFTAEMLLPAYSGGVINSDQVNLADNYASVPMYSRPSVTGLSTAPTVAEGAHAFRKQVAAGQSWANLLSADQFAFPPPNDPEGTIHSLDRVLVSHVLYGPNDGFGFIFALSKAWFGQHAFARFYFGGRASVAPALEWGGQFCVTFFGSGKARLWELENTGWQRRMEYQWGASGRAEDTETVIGMLPHDLNMLSLTGRTNETIADLPGAMRQAFKRPAYSNQTNYHDTFQQTGHAHVSSMTGPGFIRMDVARNIRTPWSLVRAYYRNFGVLVGSPFVIDGDLPLNTAINITLDTFLLPGTSVTVTLHDAITHVALATGASDTQFISTGARAYYPVFTLWASPARFSTPVLRGYAVHITEIMQLAERTPVISEQLTNFSVSGGDMEPSVESASVYIKDIGDELRTTLRTRDEIRCAVDVLDTDTGDVLTRLFEGRTVEVEGVKRGTDAVNWPVPTWHDFPSVTMKPLWADIEEKMFLARRKDLRVDEDAPIDPLTGRKPPPRVTDVIKALFRYAGVPADEIDITDRSIRLWESPSFSLNDLVLQPGTNFARLMLKLAKWYLGAIITRDHNCGWGHERGMWRVIELPQWPYPTLRPAIANFVLTNPDDLSGKLATHGGTYDIGTAWAIKEGWRLWKVAPELNEIIVGGIAPVGGGVLNTGSSGIVSARWSNPASISNPNSVDYVGKVKPYFRPPDPSLPSVEACSWLATRIGDNAGHAMARFQFIGPAIYVTDDADAFQFRPRILRTGDAITVQGYPAYVRSCRVAASRDYSHKMFVTGFFTDPAVAIDEEAP